MTGPSATTQAVILARGLGTRMRRRAKGEGAARGPEGALSAEQLRGPEGALSAEQRRAADAGMKGMMPIGRPFLEYVLSALADAGISLVTLVIGPEHGAVREHFTVIAPPARVGVRFAVQAEPRGTADALLAAEGVVDRAPFLVLNADNFYPVEAYRALSAIGGNGLVGFEGEALVALGNIERERVLRYALLDIDDDGFLREIREKPASDDPLARRAERWVSMNLWSFTPDIFATCRRVRPSPRGELELQDAVMIAIRELRARFRVVPMREGVLDLSERRDIASVTTRLAAEPPPRP